MKYWETIADNLSKAGWSWGWVSAVDVQGQTIGIVDAHGYGKRFIIRAGGLRKRHMDGARQRRELAASIRCVESALTQLSDDK